MTDNSPLLIERGTLFSGGPRPRILAGHSVLIEGGWITRIAPARSFRNFAGRRIDATDKVVMPGLINAHTHFYSAFARGLTKTRPARDFSGVLKNLWWRLDSALALDDCYYSALVALLDAIRNGSTTLIDHHASPNAVRGSLGAIERAVRQTGLRACLCYEVTDRNGAEITAEAVQENVAFLRRCQTHAARGAVPVTGQPCRDSRRAPPPHLAALFGLHASFTLSNRTLDRAAVLAQETNAGFHIHVAEAASDQQHAWRRFGCSAVERLSEHGILGPQYIAAHCVHIIPAEMDLLAETLTAVVHNPQSNLNNAVGIADVVQLARQGALVGLGTDAMTTRMLEELRVAVWCQHLRAQDASAGFNETVAALIGGNPQIASRAFKVPMGELREGWAADVILLEYDPPTPMNSANAAGHLVFGFSQAPVHTTIVGGRVLMEDRQLKLDLDESRVNARARELARKLWNRL